MKFRTYSIIIIIIGAALSLTGCWVPENFEANITVNKDGSYMFTYDGTLTFTPALASANKGSLSPEDETNLKMKEEKIKREPGFKKVNYLGKGRYKVFVEKSGTPGEQYYFLSNQMKIFSVNPKQDGSIEITAARLSERDINGLLSIGATVNGTLAISVEKGVRVIKHNAQNEPKLFGLLGRYEWEIKSFDAEPFIVVQPSS